MTTEIYATKMLSLLGIYPENTDADEYRRCKNAVMVKEMHITQSGAQNRDPKRGFNYDLFNQVYQYIPDDSMPFVNKEPMTITRQGGTLEHPLTTQIDMRQFQRPGDISVPYISGIRKQHQMERASEQTYVVSIEHQIDYFTGKMEPLGWYTELRYVTYKPSDIYLLRRGMTQQPVGTDWRELQIHADRLMVLKNIADNERQQKTPEYCEKCEWLHWALCWYHTYGTTVPNKPLEDFIDCSIFRRKDDIKNPEIVDRFSSEDGTRTIFMVRHMVDGISRLRTYMEQFEVEHGVELSIH